MSSLSEINIGDVIVFHPFCMYATKSRVIRKVNGFYNGKPTVKFAGYKDFVVNMNEISNVEKNVQ